MIDGFVSILTKYDDEGENFNKVLLVEEEGMAR